MAIEILMPALSPTMEEGTLAKWLVKEGDAVKSGQILAEIETDKATMEFEAVDEGTIGKILVAEGTAGVKVNTAIAVLLEDGEAVGAVPAAAKPVVADAPPVVPAAPAQDRLLPRQNQRAGGYSRRPWRGGLLRKKGLIWQGCKGLGHMAGLCGRMLKAQKPWLRLRLRLRRQVLRPRCLRKRGLRAVCQPACRQKP